MTINQDKLLSKLRKPSVGDVQIGDGTKRPGSSYKYPLVCNDWSEAFDACRERDRPLICVVGDELGKAFPSGRLEPIE